MHWCRFSPGCFFCCYYCLFVLKTEMMTMIFFLFSCFKATPKLLGLHVMLTEHLGCRRTRKILAHAVQLEFLLQEKKYPSEFQTIPVGGRKGNEKLKQSIVSKLNAETFSLSRGNLNLAVLRLLICTQQPKDTALIFGKTISDSKHLYCQWPGQARFTENDYLRSLDVPLWSPHQIDGHRLYDLLICAQSISLIFL